MDKVLRGTENFTGVYLDDILIQSLTWEEHLHHLRDVLTRLQKAGLTLKLKKCLFGAVDCEYLGRRGGVSPVESKVRAIKELCKPKTKQDIQTFLGMAGYYRRYIRDFATIAAPLTELTKKGNPDNIIWTPETESAFQTLKSTLSGSTIMKNPDPTKPFIVQTDASSVGVGAVLSQGPEDKPIAYFSRKLLEREKRYSAVEKECLAVVLGVKAFAVYLLGKPFLLQTDHRALKWLNQFKEKNDRLTRWSYHYNPIRSMWSTGVVPVMPMQMNYLGWKPRTGPTCSSRKRRRGKLLGARGSLQNKFI